MGKVRLNQRRKTMAKDKIVIKGARSHNLKNINLVLKPNTITALVGPSGSGKTTIAYLLGRFWDIQKGSIKIGDIDIKDIDVNYLLSNISYVFQDIFMLTDTIFENIKLINKFFPA